MTETSSATVELVAPLTGVLVPIEQVPDPVFAQKMVGEGLSIDPLSATLVAPAAGEVVDVQPSAHAVTIRTEEGLEILMHIGLDTVRLQGDGFTPKVSEGQQVAVGDPLIEFDLDGIATAAKSLLTQVVIANSERVAHLDPRSGLVTAGRDVVAVITLADAASDDASPGSHRTLTSDAILIPNPTGLHARPAATLSALAKDYTADIRLRRGEDSANAKSIMALMAMSVARGDKVTVSANGPDAADAIDTITRAIRDGLGEDCPPLPPGGDDTAAIPALSDDDLAAAQADIAPAAGQPRSGDPDLLLGVAASPGLGIGTVLQLSHDDIEVPEFGSDHHTERRRLNAALDRSVLDLSALRDRFAKESDPAKSEIFAAHQEILKDPDLLDLAVSAIDKGKSAAYAWRGAFNSYADRLAGLSNEVLAGRALDVRDVGQRVLEELTGQRSQRPEMPEGTILIAEDLTPSDTAQLDRSKVVGFATTNGGASSHVAIIARSLDLPAVAGIEGRALQIPDGTRVVLDGSKGTVQLNLTDEQVEGIKGRQAAMAERRAVEEAAKDDPAVTTDGHRIAVVANIGGHEDAVASQGKGADGVGLLRSEFVFLDRLTSPSEDEQTQVYAACARALAPGQPLVIRTLDVGGDKPLPYLPIPAEENPFLGIRGVRVGIDRPEVMRVQARAILRAAHETTGTAAIHVMFPMIATIEDWRNARAIWEFERERLEQETGSAVEVPIGIMMEVPSVGIMARQFAAEEGCDFFSVGTNDLTSYSLAMDRGHPKLAAQVDPCNPAVLTLIKTAADALHERGKWLGVCGGIASDPQAVPILVGLGVDELSCSIPAIPSIKAQVRRYSRTQCQDIATEALACSTPADVRALVPMDEA